MTVLGFNDQSYVDSLSPEAIRYFLDVTLEEYKRRWAKNLEKRFLLSLRMNHSLEERCLGAADSKEEAMLHIQKILRKAIKRHMEKICWTIYGRLKYRAAGRKVCPGIDIGIMIM